MTISHGQEQFSAAVKCLAADTGSITDLLTIAWTQNLTQIDPEQDLPAELRHEFEERQAEIGTAHNSPEENQVSAFFKAMKDDDAAEWAYWIYEFEFQIAER